MDVKDIRVLWNSYLSGALRECTGGYIGVIPGYGMYVDVVHGYGMLRLYLHFHVRGKAALSFTARILMGGLYGP
jgi:hypothetical protein